MAIANRRTYAIRAALAEFLKQECIDLDNDLATNPNFGWLQYNAVPSPETGPFGYIWYPETAGSALPTASMDLAKVRRYVRLVFQVPAVDLNEALRLAENWLEAIALEPNSIMKRLAKTGLTLPSEGVKLVGALAGCNLTSFSLAPEGNQDGGGVVGLRMDYEYLDMGFRQ